MADSNSPYRIIAAADASTLEKLVNELVKQNPGFKLVGMVAASGQMQSWLWRWRMNAGQQGNRR